MGSGLICFSWAPIIVGIRDTRKFYAAELRREGASASAFVCSKQVYSAELRDLRSRDIRTGRNHNNARKRRNIWTSFSLLSHS